MYMFVYTLYKLSMSVYYSLMIECDECTCLYIHFINYVCDEFN